MCGIVGFVGSGDRADLISMSAAVAHRGPDGQGIFVDDVNKVFLGHRRLAILDVAGGHQPMLNEDGEVGVIFNGEIYNHMELREELKRRGHVFRTHHCDTEVLVHGYEEWGEALPERLNGMFAFAIYDRPRRHLFLARDRFGEKPLYYAHRPGFFAFASELGALCCHPALGHDVDPVALRKFFAYGYIPAPHALYKGSRKLPGGHHLVLDLETGSIRVAAYWRFELQPDDNLGKHAEPALVEELRHLLSQAVRRRLISDVPLGVFLSGGLDSSTVLAMAAQHLDHASIRTFTIGFTEASFDESGFAREVATAIGTDHREKCLDLDLARDLVPSVLDRLGEPLGDASILPTYLLSAFTREHVTVALSGDGSDELFAGYDPFMALAPAELYARVVPVPLHRGLRRLADLLPISSRNMSLDFKLRRWLMGVSYPQPIWNPVWMSPVEPREMADLFEEPVRVEDVYDEAIALWDQARDKSLVDRTLEFFTNLYLQDDILAKVDRATMMVSLESRAVFLDNDLVAFCQRLPNHFKIRNGERKYLLKKALAADLPPNVITRPKKGFGVPLTKWLRHLPLGPPLRVPGLDDAAVQRRWHSHRVGAADHRLFVWSCLSMGHSLSAGSRRLQNQAA
jgi:asparagine synthase (glutamine-hydrolysing)